MWSFALDCLEHAYSLDRGMFSEIYKRGLVFCRAYSKFQCDMGAFELEELVNMSSNDKEFKSLVWKKEEELLRMVNKETESNFGSSKFIGKALSDAFNPFTPFNVARNVRTAISWLQERYHDEYDYPNFGDYEKEQVLIDRIYHALSKKELDWQIKHLRALVGD